MTDTRTLIQAVPYVPQRARRAVELMRATDGEIVWDTEYAAWKTWLTLLYQAGDDPVIVLEDDVTLAEDWRAQVQTAIAEHPDSLIQFFCHTDCLPVSGWRSGAQFFCNACIYLPAGMAQAMIPSASLKSFHDMHDASIGHYLARNHLDYWSHRPNLVRHEAWVSSVKPGRPIGRRTGD